MTPLNQMGAHITSIRENECAPLRIEPGRLHGIHYTSPVASAQVKSAVLLAGLYAEGETSVTEPALSRNHTELMLQGFGASLTSTVHPDGTATASVLPCSELFARDIRVPGDISSAAYFIAAGLLTPGSEILVRNVGLNPTRAGFLTVCQNMGAKLSLQNKTTQGGEEMADILVSSRPLHGTVIEGSLIPSLIDEIPILAVMAGLCRWNDRHPGRGGTESQGNQPDRHSNRKSVRNGSGRHPHGGRHDHPGRKSPSRRTDPLPPGPPDRHGIYRGGACCGRSLLHPGQPVRGCVLSRLLPGAGRTLRALRYGYPPTAR